MNLDYKLLLPFMQEEMPDSFIGFISAIISGFLLILIILISAHSFITFTISAENSRLFLTLVAIHLSLNFLLNSKILK